MDSVHEPSSAVGSVGSTGTYRSTRPNGRAAATAAPGPTATVQRTESASAPGCAPYDWLRLSVTTLSSSPMSPVKLSGRFTSGSVVMHSPSVLLVGWRA